MNRIFWKLITAKQQYRRQSLYEKRKFEKQDTHFLEILKTSKNMVFKKRGMMRRKIDFICRFVKLKNVIFSIHVI